jgi:FAD/FMN-containing dehydrogenase
MGADETPPNSPGRTPAAGARALTTANAGAVLLPGSAAYAGAMGRLFSPEAALTQPLCIVQPRDAADVARALKVAREYALPVTARGGSHSSLCAGDRALMIDLSARCAETTWTGEDVKVGGGATMGAVLAALAPQARVLPVGVARTPGMGLALQGGVGHLTRSLGLTLDSLQSVEIVVPSGSVLQLSEKSSGEEADLWWAVRGCGPNLGIVTSATFRVHASPTRVFAKRLLLPLDALPAYLELAQAFPRGTAASGVLGRPAGGPDEPLLFAYLVSAGDSTEASRRAQEAAGALTRPRAPLLERGAILSYADLPPMDMPSLRGFQTREPLPATAPQRRLFTFKKSLFLNRLDATAAARLVEAIRSAPTASCRIDLQQCGGALAKVPPTATAFWNRGFEWNCPLVGAWFGPEEKGQACMTWVRQAARRLAPYAAGTYAVEIVPGLPETATEVQQAFGGNLARLRALKKKWDPDRLLRLYYPLESPGP